MKITVFTSNQPRHLNLIRELSKISEKCYAIMEVNTIFPGKINDFFKSSEIFQKYFYNVMEAEKKIFGEVEFLNEVNNIVIKAGDLSNMNRSILGPALNSDVYIVFGSSYIKGWLADFLIENDALNIHMGISPYYRGSSCNFWSLYDNNPHLSGATIHMLSKGLDSGGILYHIAPVLHNCSTVFDFTMMTVKSAHSSLIKKIKTGEIKKLKPVMQDKSLEIRYTRNKDFNDEVTEEFLERNMDLVQIANLIENKKGGVELIRPFYLE